MTTLATQDDWKSVLAKRTATRGANVLRVKKDSDSALLDSPSQASSIDEERRCATFIISTSTPDRSEDVVNPQGVILDNYTRNPVVYYDHGFSGISVPIGKCEDEQGNLAIVVTDEGIEGTVFFSATLEGEQIFQLVKEKVLRAASINLQPKTYTIRTDDTSTGRPGMQIDEWELLEWSVVGIPDNPEAIRKVLADGQLAGKPICEPIRKSLSRLVAKPKLLGRNMTDTITKDGDDDGTDSGMSMSDRTQPNDGAMSHSADDSAEVGEDGTVEPEGSKALRECYSHLKSAVGVLERYSARVEHPKVSKCLQKAAAECGGTLQDVASCHKAEYAEKGQDALDTEEDDPPITSKSALRRVVNYTGRTDQVRTKFVVRMNQQIKACKDPAVQAILKEARNFIARELATITSGLSDAAADARLTVNAEPDEMTKKFDERLTLIETKVTSAAAKLLEAIPHRQTF